jgi:hypothetical protein
MAGGNGGVQGDGEIGHGAIKSEKFEIRNSKFEPDSEFGARAGPQSFEFLAWLYIFDFGRSSCGMPEPTDVHTTIFVIDAVNDPISADNDLADGWILEFRDNSTRLWKAREALGAANKQLAKPDGAPENPMKCNEQYPGCQIEPKTKGLPDNP